MPRCGTLSRQSTYAANLSCELGLAIYSPIALRSKSGRVGDIGFFQHDGSYEWIRNAFHSPVSHAFLIPLNIDSY